MGKRKNIDIVDGKFLLDCVLNYYKYIYKNTHTVIHTVSNCYAAIYNDTGGEGRNVLVNNVLYTFYLWLYGVEI